MELKEEGLDVSERRVGRLMKINGSADGDSAGSIIQGRAGSGAQAHLATEMAKPAAISQYINGFYNTQRRQSYLGGQPLCFRSQSGIMRQVTGTKPLPAHFSRIIAH